MLGITMDGTNFSAMRTFGCRPSLDQFVPSFHYEGFDDPIYFTPDPPHMLKLARNALAELSVLTDGEGRRIEWKYIQRLHDIQTDLGLKFAKKLSDAHLKGPPPPYIST